MRTSHELEGHGNSILIVGHFCGVVISWVGELSGDGLEESWSRRGQQKCVSSSVVPDSLGMVSSSSLSRLPIGCSAPASVCIRRPACSADLTRYNLLLLFLFGIPIQHDLESCRRLRPARSGSCSAGSQGPPRRPHLPADSRLQEHPQVQRAHSRTSTSMSSCPANPMLTSIAEGGALWYATLSSTRHCNPTDPNISYYSTHHLSASPYPEEDSPRVDPHRYGCLINSCTIQS